MMDKYYTPGGEDHTHCFHILAEGHMLAFHDDTICCFCGKRQCINYVSNYTISHGKFAEGRPIIRIQKADIAPPHR